MLSCGKLGLEGRSCIYLTMSIILVNFLKIWLTSNYYIDLKKLPLLIFLIAFWLYI